MLAAGFDAGVRYDERLERDMIAVPIGPREQRFVTAAAPAYLAARGRPMHPRDLLEHACIRHRFASGVSPTWEFERDGETVKVVPEGPLVANFGDLEIAAAVARVSASSAPSRISSRRARQPARSSPFWTTGCRPSPARSSTTRAAGRCRGRCAPSSIS